MHYQNYFVDMLQDTKKQQNYVTAPDLSQIIKTGLGKLIAVLNMSSSSKLINTNSPFSALSNQPLNQRPFRMFTGINHSFSEPAP